MISKLVSVLCVLWLLASLALAQVDQATGTVTNDQSQARLRVAHLVFGGPNVDLVVNGEIPMNRDVAQADFPGGYIGSYLYLEPGTYSVAVVPTGNGVDEALIGPLNMPLEAGHRYTLAMIGQMEDESLTPLVMDDTAILQESRSDPSQFSLILVNNVAGTTTLDFNGTRARYGSPGVTSIANGDGRVCGGFYIAFDDTHIVSEPGSGECELVEPGMDFIVAFIGRYPGDEGFDFRDTQSPNTSDLSALDFLRGFGGVGYEQNGHEFSFNTFLEALEITGLTEMLETGGPYLVFPPTDEAFSALPQDQLDALMVDPEALADLVRNHIVEGYYPRGSLSGEENRPKVVTNVFGTELELLPDGINGMAMADLQDYMVANGSRVAPITIVLPLPEP